MAAREYITFGFFCFFSLQGMAKNQNLETKSQVAKVVAKYNQGLVDYKKNGPVAVFEALKEYLDEYQAKEFYKNFSISETPKAVSYDETKDQLSNAEVRLQIVSYKPHFYLAGRGGEQAFWKGQSLKDAKEKMDIILLGNLEDIEHIPPAKKKTSFWKPLLNLFNFLQTAYAKATVGAGEPWFALAASLANVSNSIQPHAQNGFLAEDNPLLGRSGLSHSGSGSPSSNPPSSFIDTFNSNGLGGNTPITCPVPGTPVLWNEQTSSSYINGCCKTWIKSEKKVNLVSRTEAGMAPPVPNANPISNPKRIVIHETESQKDSPVASIFNQHRNQGWSDVGYNYIIGQDPISKKWKIYAGRVAPGNEVGLPLVGSHAKGVNSDSIGIAFMGDYRKGDIPDREAVALMGQLVGNLKAEFPSIEEVNSHGLEGNGAEAAIPGHTDCPGKGCLHIVKELNSCIKTSSNFTL